MYITLFATLGFGGVVWVLALLVDTLAEICQNWNRD